LPRTVSRSRIIVAVLVATLLGVTSYLASTVGMRALRSSETAAAPTTAGNVPEFVYSPPETVPTTADYGPVGPVSVVFAGSKVRTGLTGDMKNPWIAVSAHTGEYRALSAPHRPQPRRDAVAVSPDGTTLAWGFDEGLVLYDPVADEARELTGTGANPMVGPFSPDGRHLLLLADGSVDVLDVEAGEVVATLSGVDEAAARQAVWTPDGTALSYVSGGRLVIHEWETDSRSSTRAPIAPDATLSWRPSGGQLAATREVRGVRSVLVLNVTEDEPPRLARTVSPDHYAQQELLGYTSDNRVTVTALTIETGTLPLVYTMSTVDTAQPMQVMQLPGGGVDLDTLEVAAEPLAAGSAAFEEPSWPASDLAKLTGSILVTVFVVGLYLTRRPGRQRRRA